MARDLKLQVILDAVDRATRPLKNIAKGSAGAGAAIRQTRDHLRDLESQQKNISGFQDMTRQAKASREALGDKRKELTQLTAQINAADSPGKRLVQQQQRAQREVEKLSHKYREQAQRSRELMQQLPAKAQGIKNLGHQQADLAERIEAANRRLGQQQDALRRLGEADVAGKYRNMTGEVGRFARRATVLGGAAAGGLFALANSTASLGDSVAKTADKMGMDIGVLQELRYAGERGGMAVGQLDKSMLTFTRRVGHAARGTGAAVKAYDELGLSAESLAKLAPEKALGVVADRLMDIEDHNKRLSYASQIFDNTGGAAMLNVLKDGSAGLQEMRSQARLTGYVLSDQAARDSEAFKDSLLDVQLGMKGMKNVLGAELMPALQELMDDYFAWMIDNRHQVAAFAKNFGARLKEAVPTLIDAARGIGRIITAMSTAVGWIARMVGGFDNLATIMAVLFASKAIFSVVAFGVAIVKAGAAVVSLAKTLGLASAAMKILGITLMGTPIGWIMAAIAALAGAVYLIYRNWGAISGWFKDRWSEVREAFDLGIFGIARLLISWSPLGILYRLFTGALERLGVDVPEQFKTLGGAIIDGLLGGLFSKFNALRDGLKDIGSKAIGLFKDTLGINSPSKVFAEFGVNTMEGYQQGIQRSESQPLREITGAAKRMQQAGAGLLLGAAGTVAAAMPGSIPLDTRGPITPAAGAGVIIEGGIHISVQPSPGMDEQSLARYVAAEVQRALAEAGHQAAARKRSALHDTD